MPVSISIFRHGISARALSGRSIWRTAAIARARSRRRRAGKSGEARSMGPGSPVGDWSCQQAARKPVNFFLGGIHERILRSAQELHNPVGGVAAEAFLRKLIEQAFLDDVWMRLALAPRLIEFRSDDRRFSMCAEICSRAHRECAGRGGSQRCPPRRRTG